MAIFSERGAQGYPPRVGDCACGGAQEYFTYLRASPRGRGWWHCPDCGSPMHPNVGQGGFTDEEVACLMVLKHLYSEDGWGSRFAHAPVIACSIPRDNYLGGVVE